jgi:hypothetical protein
VLLDGLAVSSTRADDFAGAAENPLYSLKKRKRKVVFEQKSY